MKFRSKKIRWVIAGSLTTILLMIVCANYIVEHSTDTLIYTDINAIPHHKTGLLLGTSKTLKSGLPNQYFQNRIQATLSLFQSGKIEAVVISGDNSRENYNEPEDMKAELMRYGIPDNKIYLDYAGFRTLDSVVRMEKIFGQTSFTIISQEFHNRRALYIAHNKGLQAVAFNAEDVSAYSGFKTQLREKFARVKLFLDLWTNKNPKFLGEQVVID